jgi:hypothetical protein
MGIETRKVKGGAFPRAKIASNTMAKDRTIGQQEHIRLKPRNHKARFDVKHKVRINKLRRKYISGLVNQKVGLLISGLVNQKVSLFISALVPQLLRKKAIEVVGTGEDLRCTGEEMDLNNEDLIVRFATLQADEGQYEGELELP